MHYAKLDKSDRLQKVYMALRERPMTTRELIEHTGCCAISSVVSELRENGIVIECEPIRRGVYKYTLGCQC
jgi:DNA-binding transcriptional regulator GbsR (MarR family)